MITSSMGPNTPGFFILCLGGRIRRRRQAMGLSPQQLGAAVGLSSAQVQRAERGEEPLYAEHLWLIAQMLQMPLGELLADTLHHGAAQSRDTIH